MSISQPKQPFSRSARLALVFSTILILGTLAQLIYRFNLPTDGWSGDTTEIDQPQWIYKQNLVGAPSELRKEDTLLQVEGQSTTGITNLIPMEPPENWTVGENVQINVQRSQEVITLEIPVVHWTILAWLKFNFGTFENLLSTLGFTALFSICLLAFLKRRTTPSAQALLVFGSAIFSIQLSGMLPDGLSVQFDSLALYATVIFGGLTWGTVLAPSLLAFTLLFPNPKKIIQSHPMMGLFPYGLAIIILVIEISGVFEVFGWLATLGMLVASIVSLVHSAFTQRDAVSRAQMHWAIGGVVCGLMLALLTFPAAFGWVTNPLLSQLMGMGVTIGFTVMGISLGIAVLRYRLFDIDIIIRKTLLYSVLTAILAILYWSGVTLFQRLFTIFNSGNSQAAVVISTLVIAALFNPLRARLQVAIDHRFFRQRYDTEKTMAEFSTRLREDVDLDEINNHLVTVVTETVQPAFVSVHLRPTGPHSIQKGLALKSYKSED